MEIEEFAKTVTDILENARKKVSSNSIESLLHHFHGLYGSKKEFKFPPGDKKLLQLIAETVNKKLESDINFFDSDTYLSNCNMTSTLFGDVFCDKASQPEKVKRNLRKSIVSTSHNSAKNYSDATLKIFVDELKMGLESKLSELGKKLKFEPKIVEIDFDLAISALICAGVHQPSSSQPNPVVKTAAATIECFCSTPPPKIKVYFVFKKPADITKHLDECVKKPSPSNEFSQHIAAWWNFSNYQQHIKTSHTNDSNGTQIGNIFYHGQLIDKS